jgi:hypothetical protein
MSFILIAVGGWTAITLVDSSFEAPSCSPGRELDQLTQIGATIATATGGDEVHRTYEDSVCTRSNGGTVDVSYPNTSLSTLNAALGSSSLCRTLKPGLYECLVSGYYVSAEPNASGTSGVARLVVRYL